MRKRRLEELERRKDMGKWVEHYIERAKRKSRKEWRICINEWERKNEGDGKRWREEKIWKRGCVWNFEGKEKEKKGLERRQ